MLVFACHLNFWFNEISSHIILYFIISSFVSFWVGKFLYHWYTYLITQAITFSSKYIAFILLRTFSTEKTFLILMKLNLLTWYNFFGVISKEFF